jgi:endonuclease V-like protein UPF0215 family
LSRRTLPRPARAFLPGKQPHVLGIDDGPFAKKQSAPVPIVAVLMHGASTVEGVAISSFPVDGAEATDYLAEWIGGMRWSRSLHAVVLGGITIAGLGIVDIAQLATAVSAPVLAVTRRDTSSNEVSRALVAAGLRDRVPILERTPPARRIADGLFVTSAGAGAATVEQILRATRHRALLPEPLRVAHLIGAALVRGESKGRV